ncbi:MAG: HEPN domain-containing protein [Nitrospinae bacterium]|nr:HEPN domain-containing protein [Nitrospinota bacterium]
MTRPDDLWARAVKTFHSANLLAPTDPDSSASRSYYAAFYAVFALFAVEGKAFKRHATLESAVHRDLVKTGRWTATLGSDYSFLRGARDTTDYGGSLHVVEDEVGESLQAALRILEAAHKENPETFPAEWKSK